MRINKKTIQALVVSVLICVAYFLLFGARTSKIVTLKFTNQEMTAQGPEEFVFRCDYSQITGLELVDSVTFGNCLSGNETANYRVGTWENEAYGTYQLCVSKHISSYLVVSTSDQGVFVLNYETTGNTEILYNSFVKLLESKT